MSAAAEPGSPLQESRRRHPGGAVILAVAVGGMVGSLLHSLSTGLATAVLGIQPWTSALRDGPGYSGAPGSDAALLHALTLLGVNLLGSFLLGLLTGSAAGADRPPWLSAGLGVGLLGAYTSLSAVVMVWAVAVPAAVRAGVDSLLLLAVVACAALAVQALLGTLAAWSGLRLGRR